MAFIDADKQSYAAYWDELVPRVRQGGLLLVDNTLWSGTVVDPANGGHETADHHCLQRQGDRRRSCAASYILPVSDGLTIARKL